MTGAGLKELAALKELEELDLPVTNTNDDGVRELVQIQNLKRVGLERTKSPMLA